MSNLALIKRQRIQEALATAFPNPRTYSCNVLSYNRGHSQMILEVVKPEADSYTTIYLELETVLYFAGPLRWQGVDFQLASSQECKELLSSGWINVHNLSDEFEQQQVLLVLERPAFQVRVLLGNCNVSSNCRSQQ